MGARSNALAGAFALVSRLADTGASVLRNASLPQPIPSAGLVIFRDGDPGEPDVTLNPRTEYYEHRSEIEVFILADNRDESDVYSIVDRLATLVAHNQGLGGSANYCYLQAPVLDRLDVEGAPRIIVATFDMVIEYLVRDPLALTG